MVHPIRNILITGANGFIGKNLVVRFGELPDFTVDRFLRGDSPDCLADLVRNADAVIHLAGENRPKNETAFEEVNIGLTTSVCEAIAENLEKTGRRVPLILASSTQAANDSPYGRSKLEAELVAKNLADSTDNPVITFRLSGVFGKWCKPNYNSVVATFCHNIARGEPIQINDPTARLQLVHVDDVVRALTEAITKPTQGYSQRQVTPEYMITVGDLANQIQAFYKARTTLMSERVGTGLVRALYATYVSFLPTEQFSYAIPQYADHRGVFVEMLKTPDSGQFSYFTAPPGITRGEHYHHTKTEKFLVIHGQARFRFRHLLTGEIVELYTDGGVPQVVDTIPGWAHDITNIGQNEMIVMLWANEIFDRSNPDTIACRL